MGRFAQGPTDAVGQSRVIAGWRRLPMKMILKVFKHTPELALVTVLTVVGYAAVALFSDIADTEVLRGGDVILIVTASLLLSTVIAIVAVIGGVGGGVIFTPVMLAFTSIDTLVIRSTGLVVAMFSGLVSSRLFMRNGLANIRLVYFGAVPIIIGAIGGSLLAVALADSLGEQGDALVRLLLGVILVCIAVMFVTGGAKTEFPEPKAAAGKLGLRGAYWEASLGRTIAFQATHGVTGWFLLLAVGFTGGFFGLGGGWAVVPVFNLLMAIPMKVAAAASGVLLAIGNAAAIWPYIVAGALIPLFAAPWMLGQVIGGIVGAHILTGIKAGFVRQVLIVLMLLASIRLLSRGVEGLFGVDIPVL